MDSSDVIDDIERNRQTRKVLAHYDANFTKYLAATLGLTEKLPEEVNNQIRNAMTHLSRAQEAQTVKEFNQQIERANSHIDRANRDCLKASIIFSREKLDCLAAEAVFYHVALTPDIKARIAQIKKDRRDAYRAETQGKSDILERLEKLLADILFASDIIQEQYKEAGSRRAKVTRFIFRWSHPIYTLIALVLGYVMRPFTQPILSWARSQLGF